MPENDKPEDIYSLVKNSLKIAVFRAKTLIIYVKCHVPTRFRPLTTTHQLRFKSGMWRKCLKTISPKHVYSLVKKTALNPGFRAKALFIDVKCHVLTRFRPR